ncbi:hypothetical protein [Halobacterium salinarum]|uniref:Uncharacterized protein n=3 Tax=Halobacterium salinarum TaxID=2242 RepID=A0A510N8A8_HALSA|nr:hypothetical protein [Halobacterium salinarum]MBB6089201.1 hypothetical protein [Halobacterium salinarum]MDL0118234.1 hypothetical protein [Halobacterium salinarum]MDL0123505.1 hypothetical protein [Halobacterium salinarum]MDL0125853.1 hypothetical protein [Halobacterium salinarum]MDL0128523.1 hypothetical protein [Halobacterium salinarum]
MPDSTDPATPRSLSAADRLALGALVLLYVSAGLDLLPAGTVAVNMLLVIGLHRIVS